MLSGELVMILHCCVIFSSHDWAKNSHYTCSLRAFLIQSFLISAYRFTENVVLQSFPHPLITVISTWSWENRGQLLRIMILPIAICSLQCFGWYVKKPQNSLHSSCITMAQPEREVPRSKVVFTIMNQTGFEQLKSATWCYCNKVSFSKVNSLQMHKYSLWILL